MGNERRLEVSGSWCNLRRTRQRLSVEFGDISTTVILMGRARLCMLRLTMPAHGDLVATSSSFPFYGLLAASIVVIAIFAFRRGSERHEHHYPPGPKGLPIVGNIFDMPGAYGWLTFQEWARKFRK